MKLIIQIPCYNEAETLGVALSELPREIEGIDKIEWLIINDGSQDETVKVAKQNGVDHIVDFTNNQGLAKGFMAGLDACIKLGADIIVNTDADNQYNAADIPKLVKPILNGNAEIVIGERPISQTEHFSPLKKFLQKFGSLTVRIASNSDIPDAPSGFRAISRDAAMQLNVFSPYTYTLETIIQAGLKNVAMVSVPIRTKEDLRPSRLAKSMFSYIKKSFSTIIRIFVVYKPFRVFMTLGLLFFIAGLSIGIRYLYFFFNDNGAGHIQSLILSSVLLMTGVQFGVLAFIGDLIAVNRKLLEDIKYKVRKAESDKESYDIDNKTRIECGVL